jgi:peptide/nickel transport system permease protein|tara:strand:- start:1388 stop:2392 length:1005 start_codon:yes stop_codon:yes gene_type:complete
MGLFKYTLKRILLSIPVIIIISILCFGIIQLPPGDYADAYAALATTTGGGSVSKEYVEQLRERYGLDQPFWIQYWRWVKGFPQGDFGIAMSLQGTPVVDLLKERLPMTLFLNICALIFALMIALPIGLYSATHKYSLLDYLLTFIAFIGIAIPGFILAVFIITISIFWFDSTYIGRLYSNQYIGEPWNLDKIIDFLKHLPVPIIAIGIAQTSNTMRIMRGNMLDVLKQPFIQTARAKGLSEPVVNWKHAARIAINPIISRIGVYLPEIIATEMLVSIVLNLNTIGPLFYDSLIAQDMYLAGTILLVISIILVLGNLIADIALALSDPRIRYELS